MTDDTFMKEVRDAWKECSETDRDNRQAYEGDIRFGRLGQQWDAAILKDRVDSGRPCLTINRLPPFIRQVVNDGRQNRPAIKVMPQDSGADKETADIYSGLIRNIETSSDADVAYDTALDNAVSGGFGFFRINTQYTSDDSWDQDIVFDRIANPLSVYGDPYSDRADSADWNTTFVTTMISKAAYKREHGEEPSQGFFADCPAEWREGERIMVAEFWRRDEIKRKILWLSTGMVIGADEYKTLKDQFDAAGVTVMASRDVASHKVTQYTVNGVEVLDEQEWAGKYIPIIPVYGEEVNLNGKRHLRSLIRDAKDPQIRYNAFRSVATEMQALAPKVPFIGRKGAFETDAEKWETINTVSWSHVEYDGPEAPQRQPHATPATGAYQEALSASDDIKAVTGLQDASLGIAGNETSGRAINARKQEGDVSTFHYIDNLARSIRHGGRVLIDLIPHVYTPGRIARILGEDRSLEKAQNVKLGTPEEAKASQLAAQQAQERGEAIERIYALGAGKYDLTVTAGPSFTTRREEAAYQMTELIRAYPAAAPVLGDLLAKNLDWPGADEIADRLKAMINQGTDAQNPQMQELMAQVAQLSEQLKQAQDDTAIKQQQADVDAYEAQTDRLKVVTDAARPQQVKTAA